VQLTCGGGGFVPAGGGDVSSDVSADVMVGVSRVDDVTGDVETGAGRRQRETAHTADSQRHATHQRLHTRTGTTPPRIYSLFVYLFNK